MSKHRAAIHLMSTGGFYGAERTVVELAAYLRDQGWDNHVVALEGAGATELVRRATAERLSAEAFVPSGRLGFLPMVKRLRSLLQRYPRAVVHSHGYKPDLLLAIPGVANGLARVATCHSWYSETTRLRALEIADKWVLRGFDHVVAVSPEIRSDLLSSGVAAAKVSFVNNGISAPQVVTDTRAATRAEFGVPEDAPLLVQIGRLARSKRNDLLLSALTRLSSAPKPWLLLVGDGELRGQLEVEAGRLGLAGRVVFCGYRNDIPRFLAAADALVLSSDKEGLPVIILEAMALRCPIIATDVGAIAATLRDGLDAWIVPANDAIALGHAIEQATGDRAEAGRRAESAYARYRENYSREVMGRHYMDIYEAVWISRRWS
jgi:glycosyltransferase involved in cell wall biosynthesis